MYEYLTRVAAEVFQSRDVAEKWMMTYNRALGDYPINLLEQPELVETVLHRIEYGVFT